MIKGFKGFSHDMICRDFQFKEGESYTHDGDVKLCSSGFHFCENPIDIFAYYPPGDSCFHEVEGGGKTEKHDEDTKIACSEIKIGASVSLHDLIGEGIKFLFEKRKYEKETSQHTTGYRSASSATGDSSASSATGNSSAAICTGLEGKVMGGEYGCLALAWWNEKENRQEMRCAEIGCGDGSDGKLKSDVWYSLDEAGLFIEVAK